MRPNYLFKTRRQTIARARRKHGIKDYEGALEEWNELIERNQDDSLAMLGRFDCLLKMQVKEEVLAIGDRVCEMNPDSQAAQNNYACLLLEKKEFSKAAEYFNRALSLDDSSTLYYFNAGLAYRGANQLNEAAECFEKVLASEPGHQRAIEFLTQLYMDYGLTGKVIDLSMRLRLLRSGYTLPLQRRLHCMHADPEIGDGEKSADVSLLRTVMAPSENVESVEFTGARKKFGWIVCKFGLPALRYLMPVLQQYRKEQEVELIAYINDPMLDQEELKGLFDRVYQVESVHPQRMHELLAENPVDVLFDTAGQVPNNFGHIYAKRMAPRQVCWPMTHTPAELALLDRSFVDEVIAPLPDFDDLPQSDNGSDKGRNVIRIETKLARLSQGMFTLRPDQNAPVVSPLPALNDGSITFGICADLMKINQASVNCWSDVLRAVKGSKILIASQFFPATVAQDHLFGLFANAGITNKRLEFFPVSKNFNERFDCYRKMDMVLDPFPFGETLRNADAMWMGCPVLMCKHANHTSRLPQSVLIAAGREEWIAPDPDSYRRQIIALAGDLKVLNEVRINLREALKQQPLMQNERWTRDFFKLALG